MVIAGKKAENCDFASMHKLRDVYSTYEKSKILI